MLTIANRSMVHRDRVRRAGAAAPGANAELPQRDQKDVRALPGRMPVSEQPMRGRNLMELERHKDSGA
jgi:hypothetical protein